MRMPRTERIFRVLVVDDHRDAADSLGLLMEEFGHQVHVTYGGKQALDVATAFRPDVMLIDLAMPDLDGCSLVKRFRESAAFAHTKIAAVTGHKDEGHKTLALKSGFNTVLFKPVSLTELQTVFDSVAASDAEQLPNRAKKRASVGAEQRLPIDEARRIRNERESKALTQAESESAVCDGITRFQDEYLGWRAERIQAHFVKGLLVVRIFGVLTLAETQLVKSTSPENGRDLIKQVRKQLLELARPMLQSLVHEVAGAKVLSMHHDISTVTGEEVVVFSLAESPRFE